MSQMNIAVGFLLWTVDLCGGPDVLALARSLTSALGRPTGRVSHGIRAVHASGRSAHRHQYGKDHHRRAGAARRTRHSHHLHQRRPSRREGTHRRRAAAVEHQSVGSRMVSLANCEPNA